MVDGVDRTPVLDTRPRSSILGVSHSSRSRAASVFSGGWSAKGQMEIMGLAIIVILIMLGVLFAIRFVLLAPEPDLAAEFRDSRLAANALIVIANTDTDCHGAKLSQLFADCASTKSLRCPGGSSCDHAMIVLRQFFGSTFDVWNRKYAFGVEGGSRSVQDIRIERGGCSKESGESTAKSVPLPTGSGTITLSLRLCK